MGVSVLMATYRAFFRCSVIVTHVRSASGDWSLWSARCGRRWVLGRCGCFWWRWRLCVRVLLLLCVMVATCTSWASAMVCDAVLVGLFTWPGRVSGSGTWGCAVGDSISLVGGAL